MGVKFTTEQIRAIETLDRSVLVSAAAGSGKTAVLVQRIINIILSGKANVDEMLVVTFTNAAAAEMRVKLARAIRKRMAEDPDNRARLKDQLSRLYKSYISTFSSFAIRVIKEFFYEVDMEPDFRACDDVQSELMKREALDGLFEEGFVNDDIITGGSFRSFLRLYSGERSEEQIKKNILSSYDKLRSMPDYWKWAYESAENLKVDMKNFSTGKLKDFILEAIAGDVEEAREAINEVIDLFTENGIEYKFSRLFGEEFHAIELMSSKIEDGIIDSEFVDTALNINWVNMNAYKDCFEKDEEEIKKIYASFKKQITPIHRRYMDIINNMNQCYFMPDLETRIRETAATYEPTIYFLDLIKAFEERYRSIKKDKSLLDFADIEHIAVSILEKDVPAATLRHRFKYIFIDEYQDTNNIQEYLINRFACKDNVFKVGDIKQSIYRFRQAEPSIFERIYKEYSDGGSETSTAIDLNRNFRSNDATIRYINAVFGNVMDGYDEKAMLYTGLTDRAGYHDKYDFIPEVHVLSEVMGDAYSDDDEGNAADGMTQEVRGENADDEIENISKEEAEASYIADLVSQIIGTEFCDTSTGEIRKAEAKDIAILFRAVKRRGDIMARALRNVEVQAHVAEDDDYFDTVEIGIAMSLFSCIDNMKRDVPLIATLHSEIFEWTPEDLAEVRIAHRKYIAETETDYRRPPYWEALAWYADNGDNERLKSKTNTARAQILEWRNLSSMMPIEDFLWKVLVDSGYYLKVGAMYDGNRRQANLRTLVDRARKYSEDTVASLSSFLRFLDVMKARGVSNGQASMVSKDDNVVRISTIHKSKGLEYPFVIVGGLGHRFRFDNIEMSMSFDSAIGVGMPYVSPDRRYWRASLLQRAVNARSRSEELKEEQRVLYVAMTRARNKLIMVGYVDNEEKLAEKPAKPNNYLEMMAEVLKTAHNEYIVAPLIRMNPIAAPNRVQELLKSRSKIMSPEALELYTEVDRRLSYKYPDSELLTQKIKYSVSAIRKEMLENEAGSDEAELTAQSPDDEVVSLWHLTESRKKAGAADIGTAYHRIMEFLDFTKVSDGSQSQNSIDADYITERAHFLLDNNSIEEDVFRELDLGRIAAFFESDLGRRAVAAASAGKLYKEKPFTLATDWQGREILVQGIIDCCWTEQDAVTGAESVVLIDYKSNYIDPRKPFEGESARIRHEYGTQIDLYSKAIEEGTGKPVSEAYLYLFAAGCEIEMQ